MPQTNLIHCPKCQSEYVQRVHRPSLVKLLTSKKKYVCSACGWHFYSDRKRFKVNLSLLQ